MGIFISGARVIGGPDWLRLPAVGALAPAFDPGSISGLQLWLKADANVYNDAGSTLAADGDSVQQWNDQSGNTRHASKNSTAPIYKTNIQNGKPVIRWNGSQGRLDTTAYTVAQPDTIFIVAKFATTTGFPILHNGITGRQQLYLNGDALYMNDGTFQIGPSAAVDTSFHVYSEIWNGASSFLYADGAQQITGSTSNGLSGGLMIGTDNTGNFLNGDIGEIIQYNSVLSTVNRQSVESYLKQRWGTP